MDIGSATVKLVELKERKGGQFQLVRIGVEPLSPEAIVDGSIMDSSLVVDAIQKLNDQTGVKSASFATSVSGHSVIIKKIELPVMEPEELAESIQWEAEQHIPFDINDVRLDYVTLTGPEEMAVGAEQMEVLLVAVKREKVNDYVSVISQSGKSPTVVDVDAFAIQNAYELNYDLDPLKVVALINIGAGVTNINIIARGQSVFWRDLSTGGNQFTEALQREFNLSFDQAELLKRGESVGSYTAGDARKVLDAVSAEMANEIQKTFDFFAATSSEGAVDELVLSGGGALTLNLQEVLRERFGVPTELLNPFRRIHFKETDFNREWLESIAPMLAVTVGLAIRKVGDAEDNLLAEGRRRPVVARWPKPTLSLGGQDPKDSGLEQPGEVPPTVELAGRIVGGLQVTPPPGLKVFLSYASEDAATVRKLYDFLRQNKVSAWLDREDILPGKEWESEIHKAVRESHVVVVCLSRRATTKEGFFQKEIRRALDVAQEKPEGMIYIIPARLESCEVPSRLTQWQWVDLFEEQGYGKLMKALEDRARNWPGG